MDIHQNPEVTMDIYFRGKSIESRLELVLGPSVLPSTSSC